MCHDLLKLFLIIRHLVFIYLLFLTLKKLANLIHEKNLRYLYLNIHFPLISIWVNVSHILTDHLCFSCKLSGCMLRQTFLIMC